MALRRLETLLALIEGWVDNIVMQAAGDRMQGAEALAEAVRRRRASGGPAEQTFATLVGLELRPRRLREAAALWLAMTDRHGASIRDGLWNHPDLLPTADDLDDPNSFAARYATLSDADRSTFDELARLATEADTVDPAPGSPAQKSNPPGESPSGDGPSGDELPGDDSAGDGTQSDKPGS
jgi:hypothetical protein